MSSPYPGSTWAGDPLETLYASALVGGPDQVPAHAMGLAAHCGHGEQHDLDSVYLSLFDCFSAVVVARDKEEHVGCAVARVGHEVEADAKVDPLLLAVDAEPSEPELHLCELADALLLHIGDAVSGRVVPVHPQHRQA